MQALDRIALTQFAEVQARTKVLAFAVKHHRAGAGRQLSDALTDGGHERIVDGVAFFGPAQAQNGDGAAVLDLHLIELG